MEKDDYNNAITNSKPIHNIDEHDKYWNIIRNGNTSKVVILTFGDTHKSQFITAKPILDKYGFKASFFITCSYAEDQKNKHSI